MSVAGVLGKRYLVFFSLADPRLALERDTQRTLSLTPKALFATSAYFVGNRESLARQGD